MKGGANSETGKVQCPSWVFKRKSLSGALSAPAGVFYGFLVRLNVDRQS